MGPENYKISQLPEKTSADSTDLMEVSTLVDSSYESKKLSVGQIAETAMNGITYEDLNTTAKTIIGAINELLNSTPSGGMELDGSTSTWWDDSTLVPITVQGKVLAVDSEYTQNAIDYQVKIVAKQTGTNPSPQNICLIDGWTGSQITRAGRNLFLTTASSKEENGIIYTVNADGTISVSGTASGFSSINCGNADISGIHGKVTVSGIATATNMIWSGIRLYDADNVQLYDTGGSIAPSITIDLANYPTAVKLTIIVKRRNNVVTSGVIMPQVEGGQTAHAFEQYETPTPYSVSWQSVAGTVYGGVDGVTQGVLTVTHIAETYDGTEEGWGEITPAGRGYYLHFSEAKDNYSRAEILKCSCLIGTNAESSASMPLNSIMLNTSKTNLLCKVDTTNDFPTLDSWKAFLSQNPMTVLFPLAEHITYNLTPETITLLDGANTIYADCGDSTLTYRGVQSQTLLGFNMLNDNLGSEEQTEEQTEENTEELDNTEVIDNVSE